MTSIAARSLGLGIAVLASTVGACGGAGGADLFTPSTAGGGPCIGLACAPHEAGSSTGQGAGGATSSGANGAPASGGGGTDSTTGNGGVSAGAGGSPPSGAGGSGPTGTGGSGPTGAGGVGTGGESGGGSAGVGEHPDGSVAPDVEAAESGLARDATEHIPDAVAVHDACVPSGAEVCDGRDNNCNGVIDEKACPVGCIGAERNGVGYMLCYGTTQLRTWRDAETDCTGRNMHLAEVDDDAQNTWIRDLANGVNYTGTLWLGGTDSNNDGTWGWTGGTQFWTGGRNGRPLGGHYANWAAGQPFGPAIQQNCLAMSALMDTWRDMDCGGRTAFICQGVAR